MEAPISVRLTEGGPLVPGVLTTERAESSYGLPVVTIAGEVYGPADLAAVYVSADCSIELADAAIAAGFYVLGQPRGNADQEGGAE